MAAFLHEVQGLFGPDDNAVTNHDVEKLNADAIWHTLDRWVSASARSWPTISVSRAAHIFLHIFFLRSYFEDVRSSVVSSKLERHAEQLSALGHPLRLQILRFVVQGNPNGTTAGEIQAHVDLPASTLSHHLKRLVDAGLFTTRNEGTFHLYAADYAVLRNLTDYVWEDCCKRGPGSKSGGCC